VKDFLRKISFHSQGLRRKLAIAFGLIFVAILVLLNYLFPHFSFFAAKANVHLVLAIVFIIVILGFVTVMQIIEPVIKISTEAKRIAEGDFDHTIKLIRDDELGQLGDSLNRMTVRIKENMEELQVFSQKTETINSEINKRILALSSLLQISNLISQNAKLEEIIELGVDRCLASGEMTLGCLILKDRKTGEFSAYSLRGTKSKEVIDQGLKEFKIKPNEGFLGKIILKHESVVVDRDTRSNADLEEFRKRFLIKNGVIVPISSRGNVFGLLIVGNEADDFFCMPTDLELLDLLAKQISIAIENDLLATRVEKLEVIDNLTGLYNQVFVKDRLDEEIKRAIRFQRPCAFVLLSIDRFEEYRSAFGHIAGEGILIQMAAILRENISEVDKAARFGDYEFALILPEKNKRQAIEIADAIRRRVEFLFSEQGDFRKRLTCIGAVTENPVDGVVAEELILKARNILQAMKKENGNNRIAHKT